MLDKRQVNGLLMVMYEAMEVMTWTERRDFVKMVKEANRMMNDKWPQGRPEKAVESLILPEGASKCVENLGQHLQSSSNTTPESTI